MEAAAWYEDDMELGLQDEPSSDMLAISIANVTRQKSVLAAGRPNLGSPVSISTLGERFPTRSTRDVGLERFAARPDGVEVRVAVGIPWALRERVLWGALVLLALVWGSVTGLSLGKQDFAIDPLAALLGCACVALLAIVTLIAGWEHKDLM